MKKFDGLGRSLSKGEQKMVMGGVDEEFVEPDDGTGCAGGGRAAYCTGSYSNCSGASWTSCAGQANCHSYCVINGSSQYWIY